MYSLSLFGFLWVGVLLPSGFCQNDCYLNGKDGINGVPGRDGLPGAMGDKGESALQDALNSINLEELKGDLGSRGPIGDPGLKGYMGAKGPGGSPGLQGPRGSSSGINNAIANQKPAFSVLRNITDNASYGKPVQFNIQFSKVSNDFKLQTGYFICRVPGVYYFVFHASSEGHLCLRLRSDISPEISLSFCDLNPQSQSLVVSGGAVLKLSANKKVWIEPFKDGTTVGSMPKSMYSVFNGFLIYRTN